MHQTILITGATGFLGSILCQQLSSDGFAIIKFGRGLNNDICGDLSGSDIKLNTELNIDYVVHAAGKAHVVPRNEMEAREFYDVNFKGTQNLCRALLSLTIRPKAFIFISTVSVYGVDEGDLIPEEHALGGNTPYAKSKIMAEQWLRTWANENGITLSILRLPLVAGPNPPGNLGAMIRGIRSGKYLSIGSASARKSVVWAADIAKIIPTVAETGGTFNLTDGYNPTFGELETSMAAALRVNKVKRIPYGVAKLLARIGSLLGKRSPINTDKLNKITSTLTFDDSIARKFINWRPVQVLDKISEMI
ncbi:MAG: NAD-dependent epimerase/dehydratase family protein [Mucilaginibacter sp.]